MQEWRKNWADICNQYLEKNHIDARINHRSYAEQGVNLVGTVHMGVQAWQMEKQGIETDLGNLNREIKRDNFFLAQLAKKIETLEQKEKVILKKQHLVWKVCVHGRLLVLIRESYMLQNLLGKKNPTGHRWNLQRL